jgi:zinc transporter ZupT
VVVILIACFVAIYSQFIRPKSTAKGIMYGTIYGLATGVAVGLGTYIHMPVPSTLAWGWFLGGWAKGIVAGAIVGVIVRPGQEVQETPNQAS